MPDKYREILSGGSAWLAIAMAAGGCMINYISTYKQTGRLQLRWLLVDLVSSCFIGYTVFWLLLDWGFAVSECAAATAVAGNLGAKLLLIVKSVIAARVGVKPEELDTDKKEDEP